MIEKVIERISERREYALRGAWMYGYDYVHVFESTRLTPLEQSEAADKPTIKLPIFMAAYDADHPREYAGREYAHTYDIQAVSDEEVMQVL